MHTLPGSRAWQPKRRTIFHTSVTDRISFRDCRRRWYYEVVERLGYKDAINWALWTGDLLHYGLEWYYKSDRDIAYTIAMLEREYKRRDDILAQDYGPVYGLGIGESGWQEYTLVKSMLVNYDEFDRADRFFDEILHVNVERRSFVPILSATTRRRLPQAWLSGRIDLVVGRRDGIWIVDHKSAQRSPSFAALDVDDQLTGYAYVYWRAFGEVPRGALYNVLIKRIPEPPSVLKSGQLSRDRTQHTTYDLYVQALIDQGIRDVTPYSDILAALKERGYSEYFVRDGSTRSLEELHSFERRLYWEYRDMRDAKRLGPYHAFTYPNPTQRTCLTCSVEPLCHAHEKGDDVEWLKQTRYVKLPPRVEIPKEVTNAKRKTARK